MIRTMGTQKGAAYSNGGFKEITIKTCKRDMIIWRADANGQLGRDEEEEKEIQKMPHAEK